MGSGVSGSRLLLRTILGGTRNVWVRNGYGSEMWVFLCAHSSVSSPVVRLDLSPLLCSPKLTPIPFKVFLCFARLFLNQTCILASGKCVKSANLSRVETSGYWVLLNVDSSAANWLWVNAVRLLRCLRASDEVVIEEPLIILSAKSVQIYEISLIIASYEWVV